MADEGESRAQVSPPYIAFQSLKTLLTGLKEHGVPSRIDRSVLTNFSGAVGSQVITALRFLKLINGENNPQTRLHTLVEAYGTDTWQAELGGVIREAYQPIFSIDLKTATPALFSEHFKKTYGGADAVSRKCMTFFLNVVREAEMPVSKRLLTGTKPRSAPTKRRSSGSGQLKKPARKRTLDDNEPPRVDEKKPSEVLFEHFDPTTMDDDVQQAIWTLMRHFKSKGL